MRLYYEWGIRQLHKVGEELCGDSVDVTRKPDSVTVALSDGLGSGVKANILATLTTRIAMHLLTNGLPLGEVVQTLTETLPVCNIRKMAYSTFAIAQFSRDGVARVVEFDSPGTMHVRDRGMQPVAYDERVVQGKRIREATLGIATGDWIVFVSDGVLNAGIGGVHPLGWGWEEAAKFVAGRAHPDLAAQDLADKVAEAVSELYAGRVGDDVSVVVVKVRHKQVATVLTGPPADRSKDAEIVRDFMGQKSRLVVCGGTTAKIVSRHLDRPIDIDLATMTPEVPALGRIPGIDLVTEGILTLTRVSGLLRAGASRETVRFHTDGASALLRMFLDADHVHFMVGTALNPAHQNPELPHQLGIRLSVVREVMEELLERGREVTIETV